MQHNLRNIKPTCAVEQDGINQIFMTMYRQCVFVLIKYFMLKQYMLQKM